MLWCIAYAFSLDNNRLYHQWTSLRYHKFLVTHADQYMMFVFSSAGIINVLGCPLLAASVLSDVTPERFNIHYHLTKSSSSSFSYISFHQPPPLLRVVNSYPSSLIYTLIYQSLTHIILGRRAQSVICIICILQ